VKNTTKSVNRFKCCLNTPQLTCYVLADKLIL